MDVRQSKDTGWRALSAALQLLAENPGFTDVKLELLWWMVELSNIMIYAHTAYTSDGLYRLRDLLSIARQYFLFYEPNRAPMGQYWRIMNIDNEESTGSLGKLGEFFWYSESQIISSLKTPPVIPSSFLTSSGIFEEKSKKRKLKTSSWAGGRIILLGDYAGALPKGLLTDAEKKQFGLHGHDDDDLGALLYYYADEKFERPPGSKTLLTDKRIQANRILYKELLGYSQREPFSPWIWLWGDFTPSRSPQDRWIVRNLTKQEYVIKTRSRNLTQVLYCLIGCSDDPSVSMRGGELLIHGAWAGDRIDITLVSFHKREHEDESGWTDITAGVKKTLEELAAREMREFEF
ncbi:hypothetical protein C8R41DRAFT_904738 [Lentinula lateritia]|uniref:Uncharacterized protein n=1 Tax=Lentinula lateritia TaxID=40482 RepID=A0ABQ8V805_9AGAR|nr:hypothetical protein C8R41DRAFT_904738 [Lentinula lateritia]